MAFCPITVGFGDVVLQGGLSAVCPCGKLKPCRNVLVWDDENLELNAGWKIFPVTW